MALTAERLRELLDYDPETGIFTWRISRGSAKAGAVSGTINADGYIVLGVDGVLRRASRLAWLYMTGGWPQNEVDHIDQDRANNRWDNLREATHAQNGRNRSRRSDNTSGRIGVCWDKDVGKWRARIRLNGVDRHLGLFTSLDAATAARRDAELHFFGAFSPQHHESA